MCINRRWRDSMSILQNFIKFSDHWPGIWIVFNFWLFKCGQKFSMFLTLLTARIKRKREFGFLTWSNYIKLTYSPFKPPSQLIWQVGIKYNLTKEAEGWGGGASKLFLLNVKLKTKRKNSPIFVYIAFSSGKSKSNLSLE